MSPPTRKTIEQRKFLYAGFDGIDTSRSELVLENPERQPIVACDGLYADWRGFLGTDLPTSVISNEERPVVHIRHFSLNRDDFIYAYTDGSVIRLKENTYGKECPVALPADTIITSCIFNRKAIFCHGHGAPLVWDGSEWGTIASPDAVDARYCAVAAGRLVLAGFPNDPTELKVSRWNDLAAFATEDDAQSSVTKGFRFNIANELGRAEIITALSPFETGKLAIFTNDRTLIYSTDVDYSLWALDRSVSIGVGAISHNSVDGTIDELLFCSRQGVHSVRRSALNGLTMFTVPLSEKVGEMYRKLIRSIPNGQTINAVYDRDYGRYRLFFPLETGPVQLSISFSPARGDGEPIYAKWAHSSYPKALCGDFLGGQTIIGCADGIRAYEHELAPGDRGGGGWAEFPFFWHGDEQQVKAVGEAFVIASGKGIVRLSAVDERDRQLTETIFEVNDLDDDISQTGIELKRQFARRFEHRYIGVKFRVTVESNDHLRIFALGVNLQKDE